MEASWPMQQFDLGLHLSTNKTRKREFLDQMQQVVLWKDLVALLAPSAAKGCKGRPPYQVEMLLRIHFMRSGSGFLNKSLSEIFP